MSKRPYPSAFETDLYAKLQVSPRAEPGVIDAAYRALLKVYGPRLDTDDNTFAKQLGEAHVILSNSTDRRKYDDYRKEENKDVGPYRILNRIADGGFGTTYKAEHRELGEFSCLKHCSEISPHAEEILKQETRAIWNLRHFGLPIMRDLLRLPDGSYALAMSWIEGPTLEQAVEKHGRLHPENVAWITERILDTLTYLHYHGVIHGDIKPQNIIVQEDKHLAVLLDFGLSVVKPTATTDTKGYTNLFSPPEQMAGKTLVPGSDFYSLGMTMLYALGGSYDVTARRDIPDTVPEPMCDFIKKLLVRNVLDRPKHAEELSTEFQSVRLQSFGRVRSGMKKLAS